MIGVRMPLVKGLNRRSIVHISAIVGKYCLDFSYPYSMAVGFSTVKINSVKVWQIS